MTMVMKGPVEFDPERAILVTGTLSPAEMRPG